MTQPKKQAGTRRKRSAAAATRETSDEPRFRETSEETSQAVRSAASALESEIAAGIAGAAKLQRRFTEERRIDQREFEEVMERFRKDAHDLITATADRIAEIRSHELDDLSQRFTSDAHDAVEVAMNLVNLAPEIVNRLVRRTLGEGHETPPSRSSRTSQRSRATAQRGAST